MPLQSERRSTAHASLHVKCPCGRELRAKPEMAGGQIICWSCHASVPVPVPVAPGNWVARLLRMAARQVLDGRIVTLMAIGAALVTLALSVEGLGLPLGPRLRAWMPHPGVWAGAVALGLVMAGYGELLRRGSQGDWTPRPAVGPLALAWRAFICLGAGVALVLPLIIASAERTPPRLTIWGLMIALAITLVLPLVMLATYYPRGSIRDRVRLVGAMARRHPMAMLASLLILPLSLPAVEILLFLVTRVTSTLSFLIADLFPPRKDVQILFQYPYYAPSELRITWVDVRFADDAILFRFYGDALRQGYTLLGAIPASLAMGTLNGYDTLPLVLTPTRFLAYRMGFSLVVVGCMLGALAVQARWLGLLSTMDSPAGSAAAPVRKAPSDRRESPCRRSHPPNSGPVAARTRSAGIAKASTSQDTVET